MSIKKLLGIEFDHITDDEIMEKIAEAKKNKQTHIEITDPEGTIIKIDIPDIPLDKKLMGDRYY
ncbi:hypothetical protein GOV06_05720 [Candidatus Woesearchaeota archaeon]|nr:hypothetical protein [Candidatus Woesearchaeota archaeon]